MKRNKNCRNDDCKYDKIKIKAKRVILKFVFNFKKITFKSLH